MNRYNALSARFWKELYGGRVDFGAEAQCIHNLMERLGLDGPILDIGCGDGSLIAELSALGYHCIGVDRSSEMLAAAQENVAARGLCATFRHIDDFRESLTGHESQIGCVVGQRISPSLEQFVALVQMASRVLCGGGVLMLGYWPTVRPEWVLHETYHYLELLNPCGSDVRGFRVNHIDTTEDPNSWTSVVAIQQCGIGYMDVSRHDLIGLDPDLVFQVLRQQGFPQIHPPIDAGVSFCAIKESPCVC